MHALMLGMWMSVATVATGEDLRGEVRDALGLNGWAELERGIEFRGVTLLTNNEVEYSVRVHPDGWFQHDAGGPLPLATHYLPDQYFETNSMNTRRSLTLQDAEVVQAATWLTTGYWTVNPHTFALSDVRSRESGWEVDLRMVEGRLRGTLQLDEAFLPVRFEQIEFTGSTIYTFDTYRELDGMKFVTEWTVQAPKSPVEWTRFETIGYVPRDAFTAPAWDGYDDVQFDPNVPPNLEVETAVTGHLLVQVSVNGMGPGWFIFDTGAGANCIGASSPFAPQLEVAGETPVGGVGGTTHGRVLRGASMQLGPVTVENPVFVELDLDFLTGPMGYRIDGIVGYDLFQRLVMEIGVENNTIALHDPATYELVGASWQRLVLHDKHPAVEARIEGSRTALFKIDTGAANNTVTLHAPYVRENALLVARDTTSSSAGGVGGSVRVRRGTLQYFELGGHRFEEVHAEFAVEDVGAFGDEYTAGNIGGLLLGPFRLVFDYARERMAFVPLGNS